MAALFLVKALSSIFAFFAGSPGRSYVPLVPPSASSSPTLAFAIENCDLPGVQGALSLPASERRRQVLDLAHGSAIAAKPRCRWELIRYSVGRLKGEAAPLVPALTSLLESKLSESTEEALIHLLIDIGVVSPRAAPALRDGYARLSARARRKLLPVLLVTNLLPEEAAGDWDSIARASGRSTSLALAAPGAILALSHRHSLEVGPALVSGFLATTSDFDRQGRWAVALAQHDPHAISPSTVVDELESRPWAPPEWRLSLLYLLDRAGESVDFDSVRSVAKLRDVAKCRLGAHEFRVSLSALKEVSESTWPRWEPRVPWFGNAKPKPGIAMSRKMRAASHFEFLTPSVAASSLCDRTLAHAIDSTHALVFLTEDGFPGNPTLTAFEMNLENDEVRGVAFDLEIEGNPKIEMNSAERSVSFESRYRDRFPTSCQGNCPGWEGRRALRISTQPLPVRWRFALGKKRVEKEIDRVRTWRDGGWSRYFPSRAVFETAFGFDPEAPVFYSPNYRLVELATGARCIIPSVTTDLPTGKAPWICP